VDNDDTPKCLCTSTEAKPAVEQLYSLADTTYNLLKCRRCGLMFVAPKPSPQAIASLYQDESYFGDDYSCSKGYSLAEAQQQDGAKIERYAKLAEEITRLNRGPGHLLEIGCSSGLFLEAAMRCGWNVTGVDVSAYAAGHAPPEVRAHILVGDLLELEIQGGPFDFAFLSHVVEHFPHPQDVLSRLEELLRPEGRILVEVPGYVNSPVYTVVSTAARILRRLGLSPGKRLCEFFKIRDSMVCLKPYHLYEFNRRSLCALLVRHGYRVEGVRRVMPTIRRPEPTSVVGCLKRIVYTATKITIEGLNLPGGDLAVLARR